MRKEAQNSGFGHLCESDTASVLGLSLELLRIRLQPQERMSKIGGTMENCIIQWLETNEAGISKWESHSYYRQCSTTGHIPDNGSSSNRYVSKREKLLKRLSENKYHWLKDDTFGVYIQK